MTDAAQHTPLQDTQKCVVVGKCQNNHTSAKDTAKQSPIHQSLAVENTKDKNATNALNVAPSSSSETGRKSKQKSSPDMAENVTAVEKQNRASSLSTTQTAMGVNTETLDCEDGGFISGLLSKAFQKKDSDCSVTTAIVQEDNSENVHMKASFTPGPWRVSKMDNGYGYQIVNDKGNRIMGSIASNGAGIMGQSAQAKANARLIAAAPETAAERDKLKKEMLIYENLHSQACEELRKAEATNAKLLEALKCAADMLWEGVPEYEWDAIKQKMKDAIAEASKQ